MKARRRRKSSFLLCFGGKRSAVEIELDEGSTTSTYSSSSAPSSDSSLRTEERTKKKTARRLLTKILRSAIFMKSMEKGRSGAGKQQGGDPSTSGSNRNRAALPTDTCNGAATISPSPSTSSASSSSFSISSPAHPSPQPLTNAGEPRRRGSCGRFVLPTSLMLSLLLGLVVTLLPWGRLFAVLGSSTCLCVMPRGNPCVSCPLGGWKPGEVGTESAAGEWFGKYRNST